MRDDPDTHPNANREPLAVAHPDPDTVANADSDTVTNADSDTVADADTDAGGDTNADSRAEPDSDPDAGAEPDTDAGADANANTGTNPDTVAARPRRGAASGIRRHATWAVDHRRNDPGDARLCVLQGRPTRLVAIDPGQQSIC
jgi:hypothetical protein